MKGTIVIFRLPPKTEHKILNKFCQRLYGQNTSSWGGKYRYRRKGILDEIPHRKLLKGVVLLLPKDLERLLSYLEEFNALVYVRKVQLEYEDLTHMEIPLQ
ncbi:MAG: hypothetical protein QF682_06690 [Candidatus Thermoplasmatota archaeon]|jgi:hypothetical protein|nr:hypothetical protein [Candidatus Thermoplasmatota archaeon]